MTSFIIASAIASRSSAMLGWEGGSAQRRYGCGLKSTADNNLEIGHIVAIEKNPKAV